MHQWKFIIRNLVKKNKMKVYYHVIEEANYNEIGTHGFYDKRKDAEKKVDELKQKFPNLFFYIYPSPSRLEPQFVTI